MEQKGVRIFLASIFGGVLYVFGSLAVLVLTAKSFCDHRAVILIYALLGLLLTAVVVWCAWSRSSSSRVMFVLPGTFFLLGTAIPGWLCLHAVKVCVVHVGR